MSRAKNDPRAGNDPVALTSPSPQGVTRPAASRWLTLWLASVLLGLLFSVFVAGVVVVHGHSMEPTLHNDERVLVVRTGAWLQRLGGQPFASGDIVFFPDPTRATTGLSGLVSRHLLIKRIVAGPGQRVGMRAGVLYVDGRTRPEPYLVGAFHGLGSVRATRVPRGHVYVMGDNRRPTASFDSRSFGPVPSTSIEGRALLVVWPLFRRTASGWRWNVRALTGPGARAAPAPTGRRATSTR